MAATRLRKFIKIFFITLNIIFCFVFLLASLSPYLNPASWWLIGFLGLGVPYLIMLLIFSVIFWLIIKPRLVFIPLACLLIGWKQLSVVFAWHPGVNFTENKSDSTIRIVDWNVASMYGLSKNPLTKSHDRLEIAQLIQSKNPDVICLQEFSHSDKWGPPSDNISLFISKYPYYIFSKDQKKYGGAYFYGSIIFSKYPFIDSGKRSYAANLSDSESLIYADIKMNTGIIRIYTSHLQSYAFDPKDYANIEKIKETDEQSIAASRSVMQKMKLAFTRRGAQAEIVRSEIDKSPYPSIICGDFNDVPNSYTYLHIRGSRHDAFLASSFGIGRTYNALAPTLRIDYVLPDDHFNINQFQLVDEGLSDHRMLVSDVSLKK